jgi:hypothetical protein
VLNKIWRINMIKKIKKEKREKKGNRTIYVAEYMEEIWEEVLKQRNAEGVSSGYLLLAAWAEKNGIEVPAYRN